MSATAENVALAPKSNEQKYTEEMHINTLMKMTFEVDKLNDAEITKIKYLHAVSNLGSKKYTLVDFSDCHLTDAHLLIIFQIIMNKEEPSFYGTFNLTGTQGFQPGTLVQLIIPMLDKKPNLFSCLALPSKVALHSEIIRLWANATKDDLPRILISDSPEVNERLDIFVEYARKSRIVSAQLNYLCAIDMLTKNLAEHLESVSQKPLIFGGSAGSAAAKEARDVANTSATASAAAEAEVPTTANHTSPKAKK